MEGTGSLNLCYCVVLQEAFNKAFAWQQQAQCDPQPDTPGAEAQQSSDSESGQEFSGPVVSAGSPQCSQQHPASATLISKAADSDDGTAVVNSTAASCLMGHQDVHGRDGSQAQSYGQQQQRQPTATCGADTLETMPKQAECALRQIASDQQPLGSPVSGVGSAPGQQLVTSVQEVAEQHVQHKGEVRQKSRVPPPAAGRGQAGEQEG
jgi:hypothetical protein